MQNFIHYLQKKDFTVKTQKRYCKDVAYFLQWNNNNEPNKRQILEYLTYLQDVRHNTNHSRNCALNSLKHYFNYLVQNNQITTNPTNLIKLRGTKKKQLYKIFTPEELQNIYDNYHHYFLQNCTINTNNNMEQRSILSKQRNYIMLGLLVYQGITTNELYFLQVNDIDTKKGIVKIAGSKRSNERTILLQVPQIGDLINYIKNIRMQFKPINDNLFVTLDENETNQNKATNCKNAVQKLAAQIKQIEPNFLNCNQIRASVITQWLQQNGLRKTQYLAGHRYISSTEYYAANELQTLTNDIENFNPF